MKLRSYARGTKSILLGATMLMGCGAAVAQAQDAAKDAAEPEVVVVTGFKKSYADAVRAKRNNIEITDGISSDGLGRFPDLNVGEALQRVPGVQINREAEGRNATINLRGMPGSYARTTLNGVAIAGPPSIQNDQGSPLGAFNSDIFTAFVIEKSPMANAQSGGLSGNVDMQIAGALSRTDGGIFKASYEYNELGKTLSPAFTVGYNKHLSDTLAVFGTLAFKHEKFRRDTLRFNGYSRLTPALTGLTNNLGAFASTYGQYYSATPCDTSTASFCRSLAQAMGLSQANAAPYITSATGSKGNSGVYILDTIRQYTRLNEGDLITASGGIEWKPNANTKVGIVGFYTDRDLPKTTQYMLIDAIWEGAGIATPSGTPVQMSDGRYLYESAKWDGFPAKTSTRLYSQKQTSKGFVANADWSSEEWKLNSVFSYSEGSNSSLELEVDLQTNPLATGSNGVVGNITTGLGSLGGFKFRVTPEPQNVIFNSGWVWNGQNDPENYLTADGRYLLNISGSESFADNSVTSAQFDVERFVKFGPITSIKAGVRFEKNEFKSHGFRNMAYGAKLQNITQDMVYTPSFAFDFMNGEANISQNWQVIDVERFRNAVTPVDVYTPSGGGLTSRGFNIFYADGAFADYNFKSVNDQSQAYVQLKYETNVLGVPVRGNVGTRYESSSIEVTSLDAIRSFVGVGSINDFAWTSTENKYNYWLPSGIFAANLNDDLVLRGAYYKTYVRPQDRQFSPVTRVGTPSTISSTPGLTIRQVGVRIGNKDLKPYLADSFDLSLEWYNRPNGLISLAAFKKVITGRIVSLSDPARLCPADGSTWGLGTLSWDGQFCTSSQGTATNVLRVSASGNYNLDSDTTVTGVEFNIQQNFDFLPGIWRYLGGNFNYAYTTSKSPDIAPFPGISKHVANAILYYETPKYGVRAVYNYRTDYPLNANGTYTGGARSVKERGQLDLSASYNVTDKFTVALDIYNLTNEKRFEYENDTRFVRWIDYDGRTISLTARATF